MRNMNNKILITHLDALNRLNVKTAIWALGFEAYADFLRQCVKTVSADELDNWAMKFDGLPQRQYLTTYRGSDIPHRFLLSLIVDHYKYLTILERKVPRVVANQPPGTSVLEKEVALRVAQAIDSVVLNLSFPNGVEYLGTLTGLWMISCPEITIRADPDCLEDLAHVSDDSLELKNPYASLVREGKMTLEDYWLTATLDHQLYLTYDFEL